MKHIKTQVGHIREKFGNQVWGQVRDQISNKVRSQVWYQVSNQVHNQVWSISTLSIDDYVNSKARNK
jgi:hypothetical protein